MMEPNVQLEARAEGYPYNGNYPLSSRILRQTRLYSSGL